MATGAQRGRSPRAARSFQLNARASASPPARLRHAAAVVAAVTALAAPGEASAQCPVGTEIVVDYDLPGSGYSEQSDNWASWATAPCSGASYRYLSHTVGDGSRMGTATWRPAISRAGHWTFRTGYRATENRSSDADYFAYGDDGASAHVVVDQRGDGCVWVDLGTFYCEPGGNCRVVLDGTDDSQSDCADVTIFTLADCTEPSDGGVPDASLPGRCDGIRAVTGYEVCQETDTTCAGVFTDGSGCVAYCAAAGMSCVARYGGEPGCQQEPELPLSCDEDNGHASDWCECEGPPLAPDAGAAGAAASSPAGGAGGASGGTGPSTGGTAGTGTGAGAQGAGSATGGTLPAAPPSSPSDEAGCGCRAPRSQPRGPIGLLSAAGLGLSLLRRSAGRRASAYRRRREVAGALDERKTAR